MARKLIFSFEGETLSFEMQKVDRSRLYGFKDLEVLDENGNPCELATLADDGKTLIGKGGTGIGYLTADGNWSNKEQLEAVNVEGNPISPVPSSFAAPIELETETTMDDYLNHNIRLVYYLSSESSLGSLANNLKQGAIYRFDYSYRGGLVADHGFLLMNEANEIFFLVGDPANVDYVGLQQTAAVTPDEEVDDLTTESLMDFEMI